MCTNLLIRIACCVLSLVSIQSFADALCGDAERAYLQQLTKGLQPYAAHIKKSGRFAVTENRNEATTAFTMTFRDHGKTVFAYTTEKVNSLQWSAFGIRPAPRGTPKLNVYFAQGNIGNCVSEIFVRNGTFVFSPIRYVPAR